MFKQGEAVWFHKGRNDWWPARVDRVSVGSVSEESGESAEADVYYHLVPFAKKGSIKCQANRLRAYKKQPRGVAIRDIKKAMSDAAAYINRSTLTSDQLKESSRHMLTVALESTASVSANNQQDQLSVSSPSKQRLRRSRMLMQDSPVNLRRSGRLNCEDGKRVESRYYRASIAEEQDPKEPPNDPTPPAEPVEYTSTINPLIDFETRKRGINRIYRIIRWDLLNQQQFSQEQSLRLQYPALESATSPIDYQTRIRDICQVLLADVIASFFQGRMAD